MDFVPNDNGEVAAAWEIRRARDAYATSAGAIEGSPTAARLIDACVLVSVGRADRAAPICGECADVQVEGDIVGLIFVAKDGATREVVVLAALAVEEDATIRCLGQDVRLKRAAKGAPYGPCWYIARAHGLAGRAIEVAVEASARRQVAWVLTLLIVVVEAGGLVADDGALRADESKTRVQGEERNPGSHSVRADGVDLRKDEGELVVGGKLDLDEDGARRLVVPHSYVPIGQVVRGGNGCDEVGMIDVVEFTGSVVAPVGGDVHRDVVVDKLELGLNARVAPLVDSHALHYTRVGVVDVAHHALGEVLEVQDEGFRLECRERAHHDAGGAARKPVPLEEANASVILVFVLAKGVVVEALRGELFERVASGVHGAGGGELELERAG
eukprot:scaffold64219_cov28-Tisochrysis_lutea.AAC.1